MRVMLDTNALISGMVFRGPERLLLEAICKSHTLVVTDYLLAEATEVLVRKFPGRERLLDELLRLFRVERIPLPRLPSSGKRASICATQRMLPLWRPCCGHVRRSS